MTPQEASKLINKLKRIAKPLTYDEAQKKCPERTYPHENKEFKCVGGYICARVPEHADANFPDEFILSEALIELNDNLETGLAENLATHIINTNDDGNFKAAWDYVLEALCYPIKPTKSMKDGKPIKTAKAGCRSGV